jgi:hypothetical protein
LAAGNKRRRPAALLGRAIRRLRGWGSGGGEHGGGFFGGAGTLEEARVLRAHSLTAFAKVTARKSSAVMWPSSTSS